MKFFRQPLWQMAFRPCYLLASLFGAVCILVWGMGYTTGLGYIGNTALPVYLWHAHEMIWGYAGLVITGFLLTAVATWTGQPPLRGGALVLLAGLWLIERVCVLFPAAVYWGGIVGNVFFLLAAWFLFLPIWRSGNKRNYIVVLALLLFAVNHAWFHWQLAHHHLITIRTGLWAGLIVVSGFIGLIGLRVIPFFTARRLNIPQVPISPLFGLSAMVLPMCMAVNLLFFPQWLGLTMIAGAASGVINLIQVVRIWHRNVLREPLLWVLFVGFTACALGLLVFGIGLYQPMAWSGMVSAGVHLIAVGGIGLLTLGMMARTALGHTGRPMRAVVPIPLAFGLMILAALLRIVAAWASGSLFSGLIAVSALLFALSLFLFAWRYTPWLLQARADGRAG
ncbi:NnrS family protein [Stenoxybacter acetivorans]|uniref:NnrS family protein n=1 Tax=Stenoxybacter acetivorans TaxID=422441 RepID=UPI00055D2C3A|nr:NnrS family protein [Stenoxybacter acetivorans]